MKYQNIYVMRGEKNQAQNLDDVKHFWQKFQKAYIELSNNKELWEAKNKRIKIIGKYINGWLGI